MTMGDFKAAFIGLLMCGFSLAGNAGVLSVESQFLYEFEANDFGSTPAATFSFDPFTGEPDLLTSVLFDFDSRVFSENIVSGTTLFLMLDGNIVADIGANPSTTSFSFARDLLLEGFDSSLFTDGPVTFSANVSVEEANISGVWYAGTDPMLGAGGGLGTIPDFGSLMLTYRFTDVVDVDEPSSLVILLCGAMAFILFRCRRLSHYQGLSRRNSLSRFNRLSRSKWTVPRYLTVGG